MPPPRARHFAGPELKALRRSVNLGQAAMAARLGLSVSYLSQLENDDRPVTAAVAETLARCFPLEWRGQSDDAAAHRLAALAQAIADPLLSGFGPVEGLARAAEQQPALADRLIALHVAWRATEERRHIADEARAIGTAAGTGSDRLPWEEVRDWFHLAGNYVDGIDRAAEVLGDSLGGAGGAAIATDALLARLARHGIAVAVAGLSDRQPLRAFDRATATLTIHPALPPQSQRFMLAHQLASIEFADPIAAMVAAADLGGEARRLLAVGLANYAAGALLMPYTRFARAARATRHDIDRLAQGFDVSFEQACHRLSTLQRPGMAGVPVFFCRVDMAGNITKRHSATRLQFARFGGACPLWIVHEAVAIPDRILVQLAETPDGTRYVSMAKGLVKPSGSFARSPRRYAVALGCEVEHAPDFIYADAIATAAQATPIGIGCRLCPRPDCDQRAFPPADRRIAIDPDIRDVVPYRVL